MNAPTRIGLYVAGLAVVFGASAAIAGAVVPEDAVQSWVEQTEHTVPGEPAAPDEPAGNHTDDGR